MRASRLLAITVLCLSAIDARAQTWPQWGQNAQHTGSVSLAGQNAARQYADIVYDPFVAAEQAESGGDLLVHYQAPLVDGNDVFMEFKAGRYVQCSPVGSGEPFPCGPDAWDEQVWSERRLQWQDGALVEVWRFDSDWKPEPDAGGLGGWEPVFHAALAGHFIYVPGAGGTVFKLNRDDGTVAARLNPFDTIDPATFVAGPLTADVAGNIYYNVIRLAIAADPKQNNPWGTDARGAWLVKIGADDSIAIASFASLTAGAPASGDRCLTSFNTRNLPWPPSPDAVPPVQACGSQRPGLNIAPAVATDGTIYTVSRAHFNGRYGFLVAANPDLTPKWAASLRDRLNDGCDVLAPRSGSPGGCREGAMRGVDPATNQMPAGRVIDDSSSSPAVAPDGSILYGAYTRYNYARGHLLQFSPDGRFLAAYPFGWDTTPAIYAHDGTYSVVLKDNHYQAGSYCDDEIVCPTFDPGAFFITQLSAALLPEWVFLNLNTPPDHPGGFEWCVNAPAVDVNGTVYANSEDGNVYVIGQGGLLQSQLFLNLAIGAAYTPISIGGDGKIYAQNDGHLFVIGN